MLSAKNQFIARKQAAVPTASTYPTRSLRFRSSQSTSLTRTMTGTGSANWTFSCWVKLGMLTTTRTLFAAGTSSFGFFPGNNSFYYKEGSTYTRFVPGYPIDTASWYHVCVSVSSTSGKMYLSGRDSETTNPIYVQNSFTLSNTDFRSAGVWSIGSDSSGNYFDGAITSITFIDGYALYPQDFWYTPDSYITVSPKYVSQGSTTSYSSTFISSYGTHGFYLEFLDTSSLATLGSDTSGSGNSWTVANVGITSSDKINYDCLYDVPYNASIAATSSNYCTLNPLQITSGAPTVLPSWGNLRFLSTSANAGQFKPGTFSVGGTSTGLKFYFEFQKASAGDHMCGWITDSFNQYTQDAHGGAAVAGMLWGVYFNTAGTTCNSYNGTTTTAIFTSWVNTDILGVAVDLSTGSMWFSRNGVWASGNPDAGTSPTFTMSAAALTTRWTPFVRGTGGGTAGASYINFGQQGFAYSANRTTFLALNTANLTASLIPAPKAQGLLQWEYTGTNSTLSVAAIGAGNYTGLWMSNVIGGSLNINNYFDLSVNAPADFITGTVPSYNSGYSGYIRTNIPDQLNTNTGPNISVVVPIVGAELLIGNPHNLNGGTYNGMLLGYSSIYSAWTGSGGDRGFVSNYTGMQISTYTGTGVARSLTNAFTSATIEFMMVKALTTYPTYCIIWHKALSGAQYLVLANSALPVTNTTVWNNQVPTTSVSLGTFTEVNDNYQLYEMMCFTSVPGFSKISSYVGTGQTDGYFVNTGFAPGVIWMKDITASGDWLYLTNTGYTSSGLTNNLRPETVNHQNGAQPFAGGGAINYNSVDVDFLSNGFKLATSAYVNISGHTYIYIAWACSPFKTSLAR